MPDDDIVIHNGIPMPRDYAESLQEAQRTTHYLVQSKKHPRVQYGQETFRNPVEAQTEPCRHCSTIIGQLHEPLCDYEQCPVCGGQVMSCDCNIFTENAAVA